MTEAAAASVWLVDKPAGPSSHDVVARVRRTIGRGPKVGHAGTLDPFATGLLIVLVGRATRLAPYLTALDKTYVFDIRLGAVSVTGDPEGPITQTGTPPGRDALADALAAMTGPQRQRVPPHSAVKVGGERLYARARRGEEVETPERDIVIHALRLLDGPDAGGVARIEVTCSKGTYVRRLAMDIGEALGCGAYCATLRRTAVGTLDVADAVEAEEVRTEGGIGLTRALAHLPSHELGDEEAARVAHGIAPAGTAQGVVALLHRGRLVAVARGDGERLRPEVVLPAAAVAA